MGVGFMVFRVLDFGFRFSILELFTLRFTI